MLCHLSAKQPETLVVYNDFNAGNTSGFGSRNHGVAIKLSDPDRPMHLPGGQIRGLCVQTLEMVPGQAVNSVFSAREI